MRRQRLTNFHLFRIPGLQIAEHFAQPNLVANCSRVELVCSLTSTADAVVSWAFHGENAAKLPSAHVQRDYADARWRLIIDCATIRHAGRLSGFPCGSHDETRSQFTHSTSLMSIMGKLLISSFSFPQGTYVCLAHRAGKQEIVYRKEAVVQVYGE